MDTRGHRAENSTPWTLHPIEQPAGPDALPAADLAAVDAHRRNAYQSYEAFLRQQLERLDAERFGRWSRDYSSIERYLASVAPMRDRLRAMFGWWREPSQRGPLNMADEQTIHEDDQVIARRFTFEVLPGLRSYGVEMWSRQERPRLALLAQHGYGGCPEGVMGFGPDANGENYSYRSLGLRAARHGFHVVAVHHPTSFGQPGIKAVFPLPGFERFDFTYGKNRLHRLATLAGHTLFGLDLMASSRGVDLLVQRGFEPAAIGAYGLSQGGQTALYLPAVDPRIHAAVAACYFNQRLSKLVGPVRGQAFLDTSAEDKFFTDVIPTFADSDTVSLIAPRAFAVEAGQCDAAVDIEKAWSEFQQAAEHYRRLDLSDRVEFITHEQGHVSATGRAMQFLAAHLTPRSNET
jgi:dienelactone hydrolase